MNRYAIVVVVGAESAEEAWEFTKGMLVGEVRWDRPLAVDYIGAPWQGIPDEAEDLTTEGISLAMQTPGPEQAEGTPAWRQGVRELDPCD